MALINLRNALVSGKRLPYDAEVEYLESTGTQWIDTGIAANSDLKVECSFKMLETPNNFKWLFAARSVDSAGAGFGCGCNGSGYITSDYNGRVSALSVFQANTVYNIVKDKNVCTVNDVTLTNTATTFTQANRLPIWGLIMANGSMNASVIPKSQCFYFRIYSNGVLVRDYIPVRRGTVGYLYDRVSGKLFGNAGTGDFVLGPDVVPVEWIQTDGAAYIDTGLEMADGHEVRAEHYFKRSTTRQLMGSNGSRQYYGVSADGYVEFGLVGTNKSTVSVDESKKYLISYAAANRNNTGSVYDGSTLLWSSSGAYNKFSDSFEIFRLRGLTEFPFVSGNKIVTFKHLVNGAAIQNLISVRVGTEGAMMDVLTRRIYRNAGTGAFGYGNDLKYPIPAA